jgi:hypothetical protein
MLSSRIILNFDAFVMALKNFGLVQQNSKSLVPPMLALLPLQPPETLTTLSCFGKAAKPNRITRRTSTPLCRLFSFYVVEMQMLVESASPVAMEVVGVTAWRSEWCRDIKVRGCDLQ